MAATSTSTSSPQPPRGSSSWLATAPFLQFLVPSGLAAAVLYHVGETRNRAYFEYFSLLPDSVNYSVVQQVSESAKVLAYVAGAALAVALIHYVAVALTRL